MKSSWQRGKLYINLTQVTITASSIDPSRFHYLSLSLSFHCLSLAASRQPSRSALLWQPCAPLSVSTAGHRIPHPAFCSPLNRPRLIFLWFLSRRYHRLLVILFVPGLIDDFGLILVVFSCFFVVEPFDLITTLVGWRDTGSRLKEESHGRLGLVVV